MMFGFRLAGTVKTQSCSTLRACTLRAERVQRNPDALASHTMGMVVSRSAVISLEPQDVRRYP